MRIPTILATLIALAPACFAQAPAPGVTREGVTGEGVTGKGVAVENAWARATASAASTGAAYLTIIDHGAPDRLVSASTPIAGSAELHQTTQHGGVMEMRPVDGLAVSAGKPVTLAPGGYHLMLMGLRQPLHAGESFPLTLRFEKSGAVQVSVAVQSAGAMTGPKNAGGAARAGH
jgi:periplasmic copper chaperone A